VVETSETVEFNVSKEQHADVTKDLFEVLRDVREGRSRVIREEDRVERCERNERRERIQEG